MSAVAKADGTAALERYRTAFAGRFRDEGALTPLRRAALEEFLSAGFPTQRQEEWRYTNLRRFETRNFVPSERTAAPVALNEEAWIAQLSQRVVFVNGNWMPTLSQQAPQPPGVTVLSLGRWLSHEPAEVAALLAQQPVQRSPFENLNTAFVEDGVVIELAEGTILDTPIYVLHRWDAQAQLRMSQPRILVRAGRNSRCTLVEHYIGAEDLECFTNAVATLDIETDATVDHYRIQQESKRSFHIGTTRVRVQGGARYQARDVALGASLGRHSLFVTLAGAGASAHLHGLFVPGGAQHLDTYTRIEHAAPHTISNEEYRGIAEGRGRGVFNGKVVVQPGAQKIEARQSSRNLLLSAGAEIDTRPELEIYANDVKCSHGATTGQLDAAALFYLRSRGLSESDARALLIRAFAEAILLTMECAPVRRHVERQLDERFTAIAGAQP
jgi:Fe-S cluster assembly protein SufD